jgi:TRAP transporter 4TM/12TM fusion protein
MTQNTMDPAPEAARSAVQKLVLVLAALLPLGTVIWAFDLLRRSGLVIYPEQFGAAMLGVAIALVYLHVPAGQGRERLGPVPWYDIFCALLGFGTAVYVALNFPEFSTAALKTPGSLVAGFILIPLLLEGARRTAGLPITLVAIGFLLLGLTAYLLPGDLAGRKLSANSLVHYVTWNTTAILGTPTMIVITVVVAFVLFGQGLLLSGGSGFFTDIAMALMGRYRGGQAKIAIMASALFGTISGSVVANVVSTGVVTIPMMKRAGYRAHVAGAVEAVASTGGQLMPPVMGVSAFLMAEFLQVPYATIALAALIPAVIYFAALFIQVDLEAARHGIVRVPEADIPHTGKVLKAGWFIPVPFVVLVASIFWLNLSLDLAAIYALVAVLISGFVIGYQGKRLNRKSAWEILTSTGFGVLDIFMIAPLAGIVIGVLNVTGLSFTLALSLVALAGGSVVLLLFLTGGVSIILGMGMPTVGVYILLATLVAPALINIGIEPLAAHLFIFYYGMLSMITPPVAIGAFAAASISGASAMRTAVASMRFGWSAFIIPFMFIFSPSLLLKTGLIETFVDTATALLAVWLIAAGFTGYSVRRIIAPARVAYVAAGLSLLLPLRVFEWSHWANMAGLAAAAALLAFDWLRGSRSPAPANAAAPGPASGDKKGFAVE